ncbi:MAG: Crp/Fnr family transcriptional regulator [Flavobacteriales bacterium]|nr:Crp/Fnr family transcriptional regulator [Flavobacteriales bacterium]
MDSLQKVLDFLSAFTKTTWEEKQAMIKNARFSSFKKNEIIQEQGKLSIKAAFILRGSVRYYYVDEDGSERTVHFGFEGQPTVIFDSFQNQIVSNFSIQCMESTHILWTSRSDFFGFIERFPRYQLILHKILSEWLEKRNNHVKFLNISAASERYRVMMKDRPKIIKRVPLKYIASYLNITQETLSRIRAEK